MDNELFSNLLQSLGEAIDYSNGDKSKGRSVTVTVPDEEIEANQVFFQRFAKLSAANKQKAMKYINELEASS